MIISKGFSRIISYGALMVIGLANPAVIFAAESALPSKPQAQSKESQAVQPKVDKKTADKAEEKRKKLMSEATFAINKTKEALKALDEKKTDKALKALEIVTGKLELIIARDPKLALAPVDIEVVIVDLFGKLDAIEQAIKEAKDYLDDGEIQKARPLVSALASEIRFNTINIPLATYPQAIKEITPLIDAGKVEEAKEKLQAALGTLVVTPEVVPLPKLRADQLLEEAQKLAEKKDRSKEENEKLAKNLNEARDQLKMSELLGYGKKKNYKSIYEQITEIEKKTIGGKSGMNWFKNIKQKMKDLF